MDCSHHFPTACGVLLLLAAARPATAQTPTYRCVVADARTRAALPAATVQADGRTLRTDESGRFELPARPAQLQLSHVGYQPRQWQPAPAADTLWLTPQAVALPNVRVRAQPGAVVWRYAGKSRWPHDAFARSLMPGEQVAVFYRPADSTRQYRIRAVRVRLGHRAPNSFGEAFGQRRHFVAGRLRVCLSLPGPEGAPVSQSLAPAWVITPAQSAAHQDGWLQLAVPTDAPLLLPAAGVFVVATGLTDTDTETAPRLRTLQYQRRNPETAPDYDHKSQTSTRVNLYVEVKPEGAAQSHLVNLDDYPAVAQRTAPDEASGHSWLYQAKRWQSQQASHAELRKRLPDAIYSTSNYELVLEVEEL
ncbi:carboxypeptidase-like regulatory domain-containing protein [Hymenobacter jeollabukensis]|uniref:Carboxypeptidase-like regulatory domain-containing protein n=1 Tax=Hymenobacter jeollabukensis TaxID=2025313 RepID=A0A5R8WQV0_9BACT|nr:carboxypeptidase-like regulatory domain-containing protein [Hymenobacter jeollabukensis]TLM93109.1 carboxypeptidase-like regulatory domain-containing protein [Hymenobacter jeollabukensis]